MKFITEADLRDLYKKKPFSSYEAEPGAKLTPGARQFLADIGMPQLGKSKETKPDKTCRKGITYWRLKSLEASFLLTGRELSGTDPCLAERVLFLAGQVTGDDTDETLFCVPCTGIRKENFSDCLEDCFPITQFHLQLEKSREILLLHQLRCQMQETAADMEPSGDSISKLSRIANTLSQMICSSVGGTECQRKE